MKKVLSKNLYIVISLLGVAIFSMLGTAEVSYGRNDRLTNQLQTLVEEITTRDFAYSNLTELTRIGPRLSGSPGADAALEWLKAKLHSYNLENIRMQPVLVPRWVRGKTERATAFLKSENSKFIIPGSNNPVNLKVTALGNSVGTPKGGLEAEVLEVQSLQEVERLGAAVRGKIIFYNRKMDPTLRDTFEAYGRAVDQRRSGPSQAARFGAVAVLIRSLTTLEDDDHPHTGMLRYRKGIPAIPAGALSTHSANQLSALLKAYPHLKVKLELSAQSLPWVTSYNVMAEIVGSEFPEQHVVVGAHLDSWDLGTGAHDNGTGVVQCIEVLRSLKALGIKPKRTIRAVFFMAEEFGGIGGLEYAKQVEMSGEKHTIAIESDRGGFAPLGFSLSEGHPELFLKLQKWKPYLAIANADQIEVGGSGTDVEPLERLGVPTLGFVPESKHYFDFHHSSKDTLDAVNSSELKWGAAAITLFAYLASIS